MKFRKCAITATAAAAFSGLAIASAPTVHAGDVASPGDLSGRWSSVTLSQTGAGWRLTLRPVPGQSNAYVARFGSNFGSADADFVQGPRMRLTVRGTKVILAWRGVPDAAPAPGQLTIVRGTIGQDGSIFLPRCYEVVSPMDPKDADEGCLFQQQPIS